MMSRTFLLAPIAALMMGTAGLAQQPAAPLPAGMAIEDIAPGTGAEAKKHDRVTVHYTGWLWIDGTRGRRFDSSRGGEPFTFTLGAGEVIKGWDIGVAGMKEGGIRTLIIPPQAAYGDEADDTIPANSWLRFEVELITAR